MKYDIFCSEVLSRVKIQGRGRSDRHFLSFECNWMCGGNLLLSFRSYANLGRRHRGKTVRLRRNMSGVVAWSRVGSSTTCQARWAALGSPLLLNQRHLCVYENIKEHSVFRIFFFKLSIQADTNMALQVETDGHGSLGPH